MGKKNPPSPGDRLGNLVPRGNYFIARRKGKKKKVIYMYKSFLTTMGSESQGYKML